MLAQRYDAPIFRNIENILVDEIITHHPRFTSIQFTEQ